MSENLTIVVRSVEDPDLAEVLAVYRQCQDFLALGPQPCASMAMVREDLAHSRQERSCFCGIFDPEDAMVGVLDYLPDGFEGDPQQAFITLLMVARPHRCHGIGAQVLAQLEAELQQRGQITRIYTAVQANNPLALKFWDAHGYRVIGGPTLQPDTTVTFRLMKEITPFE